ncbi:hypothetical protein HPB49_002734 [Dermacentor silvarum]|uniref:Uncharacterized protein n=1 Tax=Dermacentor silvarum TaxID=543639 RepID=A0ACB8DAA9_DERSI|nr:hypothetical protein HPB49_002734 [Dermacentor silvarum]
MAQSPVPLIPGLQQQPPAGPLHPVPSSCWSSEVSLVPGRRGGITGQPSLRDACCPGPLPHQGSSGSISVSSSVQLQPAPTPCGSSSSGGGNPSGPIPAIRDPDLASRQASASIDHSHPLPWSAISENAPAAPVGAVAVRRSIHAGVKVLPSGLKILSDDLLSETLTEANLSEAQQMLVRECVEAARHQSKKGRRYTNNWLLLCLLLHIRSPSAYRFFRENDVLPLPSVKTIRRYISRVDMKCGFDKYFFSALKNKLQMKPTFSRHGMLLMDEMQVRQCKRFNSRTLTYDGFVDQGEQSMESPDLADHALVLMFCPFTDSYAQPVAVFASKNATRGTVLCQLLLQAIVLLEEAGAIIDGVVCDGASTNRTMWKHLGVSGDMEKGKHFFEHPLDAERNVYVFSDVPHLFKCIRNRLLKQKYLKVNGKWVKWSHYVSVLKEDEVHHGGLKVCPKITQRHIYPSNMDKMRVKFATQVFSLSMAAGIKYYREQAAPGPGRDPGLVDAPGAAPSPGPGRDPGSDTNLGPDPVPGAAKVPEPSHHPDLSPPPQAAGGNRPSFGPICQGLRDSNPSSGRRYCNVLKTQGSRKSNMRIGSVVRRTFAKFRLRSGTPKGASELSQIASTPLKREWLHPPPSFNRC